MAMEIIKFLHGAEKSPTFAYPPQGEALGIFKGLALGLTLCAFFLLPFSASAGTIRKPPNNLGLVAYWPMNEGSGTVVTDHSGNGRRGTFAGTGTMPSWVNGKRGKALDFSGITTGDGRIGITALNVTNTHTVSMWIYLTGDCTNYGNLFSADIGNGLFCYVSGATNQITYYYSSSDHFNSTALKLNSWYHVAVVNNGGSVTFYLNGVADGTSGPTAPGYSATVIGNDSSSEDFPGIIDDLRVYNRALSATEIATIYRAGSAKIGLTDLSPGTLKDSLAGHWTFDGSDISGTTVTDKSGNGRNGTLTNGPVTAIGKLGQALNFDGTNDYVDIGNLAAWEPSSSQSFSVGFWYKGLRGSDESFLSHSMSVASFWYINQDKALFCGGFSCNTSVSKSYVLPNNNDWHHITIVLDRSASPDSLTAYIDGVAYGSAATGSLDDNATTWGTNTRIGGPWWSNPSGYRQGPMDDVRIYNRALSASEVKQLYNLGK